MDDKEIDCGLLLNSDLQNYPGHIFKDITATIQLLSLCLLQVNFLCMTNNYTII